MDNLRKSLKERLVERRLDTSKFRAWLDEEEYCVTFPLWNLSGKMVGYQRYRPDADKTRHNDPRDGRYFTKVNKAAWSVVEENGEVVGVTCTKDGNVGVWGMESWYDSPTLFVQEGVFDASALNWYCGVASLAVTTSTPSPSVVNWFWTVSQFRKVVVFCDGDNAGLKLAKLGHEYHVMPGGMDMGDASEEYVKEMVRKYL